jgi:hypothetical protein
VSNHAQGRFPVRRRFKKVHSMERSTAAAAYVEAGLVEEKAAGTHREQKASPAGLMANTMCRLLRARARKAA